MPPMQALGIVLVFFIKRLQGAEALDKKIFKRRSIVSRNREGREGKGIRLLGIEIYPCDKKYLV